MNPIKKNRCRTCFSLSLKEKSVHLVLSRSYMSSRPNEQGTTQERGQELLLQAYLLPHALKISQLMNCMPFSGSKRIWQLLPFPPFKSSCEAKAELCRDRNSGKCASSLGMKVDTNPPQQVCGLDVCVVVYTSCSF